LRVFLDTGAFLALADEDDDCHPSAKSTHADLILSKARLFTSNLILSETFTITRFRVGHRVAVEFMNRFDDSGVRVIHVTEAIEKTAKTIFARYDDKEFSFVDCTSFALIDHHRLDHAFAFDGHFRQYRFKRNVIVLPTQFS